MSAKPNTNCPRCGNPIPETALDGECPHCLMQMNLADPTVLEDETDAKRRKMWQSRPGSGYARVDRPVVA